MSGVGDSESDNLITVVMIGSGNVASHLSRGLADAGCHIRQVFSRKIDHARRLAMRHAGCEAIDEIGRLAADADFYLISTTDAAISGIVEVMPHVEGIVAHTSGSVPLEVLASASRRTAVIYPLQTFTRDVEVDLSQVPFFTEASDRLTLDAVDRLVGLMSSHVAHADSAQRSTLHIAGVLSCNFVNYLWDCADELLKSEGYDFTVIEPLIRVTLAKASTIGPHCSQTGPAVRCDVDVMQRHMARLDSGKREIYLALSRAIIGMHNLKCDI